MLQGMITTTTTMTVMIIGPIKTTLVVPDDGAIGVDTTFQRKSAEPSKRRLYPCKTLKSDVGCNH